MYVTQKTEVLLNTLKIATAKIIGEVLYSKGLYGNPHSARTNAQSQLRDLVDLGKIEYVSKGSGGFYRTLDCKSNWCEHAEKLSTCLAEILKFPITTDIYREKLFPIGTRSDAVILIEKDGKALVVILEVANNETHDYLQSKLNAWKNWKEAPQALAELFSLADPVKHFSFVVEGMHLSEAVTFSDLLKELST